MKLNLMVRPLRSLPFLGVVVFTAFVGRVQGVVNCLTPPPGLVSWWRAESNALDQVGGNNGTLAGNTSYGSGRVGQAFAFDGNGDGVLIGNPAALQLQNFTIETWIKRANISAVSFGSFGIGVIVGYGLSGYALALLPSGQPLLTQVGDGGSSPATTITDTAFHHLAVTKSGSTVVFYIDGVAYPAPAYDPGFVFTTPLAIGAKGDGFDNSFLGSVDEMSIYNRALSASEVQAIYTADGAGKCLPAAPPTCLPPAGGLVAWWPMQSNAVDVVGGQNGTLSGNYNFMSGEVGLGLNVNGNPGGLSVPDSANLDFGPGVDFSMEIWIKPVVANTAFGAMGLIDKRVVPNSSQSKGYLLAIGDGQVAFQMCDSLSKPFLQTPRVGPDLRDGAWHHVAVTVMRAVANGGNLYVDGQVVLTFNPTSQTGDLTTTAPVLIGLAPASQGLDTNFRGGMDEPSIYRRALTTPEIQAIYNAGAAGKCTPATPPSCTPPPSGLVAWWPFQSNAVDIVGGNNGSVQGNCTFLRGEVGSGVTVSGAPGGVSVLDNSILDFGPGVDFSMELWIKPVVASTAFGAMGLLDKRQVPNISQSKGFVLAIGDGRLAFQMSDSLSKPFLQTDRVGPDLRDGAWHHVAVTVMRAAANGGNLYVDGQVVLTFDPTSQQGDLTTTAPLLIGLAPASLGLDTNFRGGMDEPSIYRRALTTAEVQSIYDAGAAGKCVPATPPSCTPPPSGLVSWWKAESNALDQVGGNNGTLAGNTSYGSGRVGQGFVFDGNGDGVLIGNPPALQLQNFTIETWMKRGSTSTVSYGSYGIGVLVGYGLSGYALALLPSGQPLLTQVGDGGSSPATTITDTAFHHLAVTKSGSTVVFYIDGVAYPAPDYNPGFVFSTPLAIGAKGDGFDNSFLGTVDEMSIYNRALSAAEVQAIYSADGAGKCVPLPPPSCVPPPSGLVAWWPMQSNAVDVVGGHNGALIGSYTFGASEVGLGLSANGNPAGVSVPDSADLDFGSGVDFSMELWIKPVVATTAYGAMGLLDKRQVPNISQSKGFALAIGDGQVAFQMCDSLSKPFLQTDRVGPDLRDGAWHHVAVTVMRAAANGGNLYVDGQVVLTFDPTSQQGDLTTTVPLLIGLAPASLGLDTNFRGGMDEPSIYRRALAASEVQAIYNAGAAGKCVPVPPPSCVPPPSGLVAWWPMQSNAVDVVGGHNGALIGSYTFGASEVGLGLSANGNPAGVSVPDSADLDFGSGVDFSMELWIKPVVATTAYGAMGLLDKRQVPNISQSKGFVLAIGDGQVAFQMCDSLSKPFLQTSRVGPDMRDGGWHHVAVTVMRAAANGGNLYVDGQVVLTFDPTSQQGDLTTTSPLLIGLAPSSLGLDTNFRGGMDEPSIYRRALAASEVQAIYNAGAAGKCVPVPPPSCTPPPSGLVAWWPFQSNAVDVVGGHNGALIGSYTFGASEVGLGLSANGNPAGVSVPDSADLDFGPEVDFSMELWIKPVVATTAYGAMGLIDKRQVPNISQSKGFVLAIGDGQVAFQMCDSLSKPFLQTSRVGPDMRDGVWHHVAVTVVRAAASGGNLYVDGQIVLTFDPTSQQGDLTTTAPVLIGLAPASLGLDTNFRGGLDEPSIYRRALSNSEIQAIYQAGIAGKCPNQYPIARCQNAIVSAGTNCVGTASVDNGSFDPDGDPITISQVPPGPYPLGTNAVTLVVADNHGGTNTCSALVIVLDKTAPDVACPGNILRSNDLNQCGAVVNFPLPIPTDLCSAVTNVTCIPAPGAFFPVGSTTVQCTATDAVGNAGRCSFTVTVRDAQPPTITCPSDILVTNAHNASTSMVTYTSPAVSDNCPGVGLPVCNPPSGSALGVGVHTVNCSVIDAAGNSGSCSFKIVVYPGNVPPVPVIEVSPLAQFPGYTNLIVIAPDGLNASVTFDGSKSYDLDDTNLNYFWYEGTNLLGTNVVMAENLSVGSHDITLLLDNTFPMGTSSASVTVEVITPAQSIGIVIGLVENSSLARNSKRPLMATLKAAAASFERDDIRPGINQLNAFQNKVRAQVAPFDPALANELIGATQAIINALGGK